LNFPPQRRNGRDETLLLQNSEFFIRFLMKQDKRRVRRVVAVKKEKRHFI